MWTKPWRMLKRLGHVPVARMGAMQPAGRGVNHVMYTWLHARATWPLSHPVPGSGRIYSVGATRSAVTDAPRLASCGCTVSTPESTPVVFAPVASTAATAALSSTASSTSTAATIEGVTAADVRFFLRLRCGRSSETGCAVPSLAVLSFSVCSASCLGVRTWPHRADGTEVALCGHRPACLRRLLHH